MKLKWTQFLKKLEKQLFQKFETLNLDFIKSTYHMHEQLNSIFTALMSIFFQAQQNILTGKK